MAYTCELSSSQTSDWTKLKCLRSLSWVPLDASLLHGTIYVNCNKFELAGVEFAQVGSKVVTQNHVDVDQAKYNGFPYLNTETASVAPRKSHEHPT